MKKYEMPEIEMKKFELEDVIATSTEPELPPCSGEDTEWA